MPAHNFGELFSFSTWTTLIIWLTGDINAVVTQSNENMTKFGVQAWPLGSCQEVKDNNSHEKLLLSLSYLIKPEISIFLPGLKDKPIIFSPVVRFVVEGFLQAEILHWLHGAWEVDREHLCSSRQTAPSVTNTSRRLWADELYWWEVPDAGRGKGLQEFTIAEHGPPIGIVLGLLGFGGVCWLSCLVQLQGELKGRRSSSCIKCFSAEQSTQIKQWKWGPCLTELFARMRWMWCSTCPKHWKTPLVEPLSFSLLVCRFSILIFLLLFCLFVI